MAVTATNITIRREINIAQPPSEAVRGHQSNRNTVQRQKRSGVS